MDSTGTAGGLRPGKKEGLSPGWPIHGPVRAVHPAYRTGGREWVRKVRMKDEGGRMKSGRAPCRSSFLLPRSSLFLCRPLNVIQPLVGLELDVADRRVLL